MQYCAKCGAALVAETDARGERRRCPVCGGVAVTRAALSAETRAALAQSAWRAADQQAAANGAPCPQCAERMVAIGLPDGNLQVQVAGCPRCDLLWSDAPAARALGVPVVIPAAPVAPEATTPVDEETPATPEARMALAMIEADNERRRRAETYEPPDELWKRILAVLGYPVETDETTVNRAFPWLTMTLVALVSTISLAVLAGAPLAIQAFGFIPSQAWRYAGLTFLTPFFLHGDFFHLLGNMYALAIFGKSVERRLGVQRYALLLLGATFAGSLFHYLANLRSDVPCIGASGGIAGVMLVYALCFPQSRFALCFIIMFRFVWVRLRAFVLIILWILLQGWIAIMQGNAGGGGVAIMAHLGGAFAGYGAYLLWRDAEEPSALPQRQPGRYY